MWFLPFSLLPESDPQIKSIKIRLSPFFGPDDLSFDPIPAASKLLDHTLLEIMNRIDLEVLKDKAYLINWKEISLAEKGSIEGRLTKTNKKNLKTNF